MAADVRFERLIGGALRERLVDIAALRCTVFREWPYLYDGEVGYERDYLAKLADGEGLAVGAFDASRMVGVSTAMPLAQEHEAFLRPFHACGSNPEEWYYLAESVLLPDYRGVGIGVRFFQEREAVARDLGFGRACFCAVVRPDHHPGRPTCHVPLDGFWRNRGYRPMDGVTTEFAWREVGADRETEHTMQFWEKRL